MPALGGSLLALNRSAPTPAREETTPAPPRILLWASAAVVVVGVVMVVVGALRTGISWDEPYHIMRLRNFVHHGWFAVDWSVDDGGVSDGESNTLVYGPVAMLLLHALSVLFGVESWNSVATTPEAYAVRHLGVALIGLAGTAAAAAITRTLLGSWRWALVTAAALLALPMWTGHAMFNVKDVPVATGYTLVTLALVTMARPEYGHRVVRVLGLTAGVVLMVGTRPGMVTAVAAGTTVLVAGLLVRRAHTGAAARPAVAELLAGLGLAVGALVALYPNLYAHPLLLLGSAERSADFRGGEVTRLYVPAHLVAQFPVLLQCAFVIGLVWVVRYGLRHWRTDPTRVVRLALVVAQVAALPLAAILSQAELYNGLRQLLFLTPAWAVVATLGLAKALAWSQARSRRPRLTVAATVVALVAPVVTQAVLFPYQYAYWNVVVDGPGIHVHSDYWRTSVPELLPDIPTDGQVVCSPTRYSTSGALAGTPGAEGLEPEQLIAGRFSNDSSVDCRRDPLGPLAPLWTADRLPDGDALPHGLFYVIVDRDHGVPRNCRELASVDRLRHGRSISMTYVARCRLAPPLLDDPVAFVRSSGQTMTPATWGYAPQGWVNRGTTVGIEAPGRTASLTFTVPPGCRSCALVVDGDAPDDVVATVDGRDGLEITGGSMVVPLTAGVSRAWVTFTRRSGAPLGLLVESIRIVPTATGRGEVR